jgi:metal-dependent amidase/aminoacylase/carboxypeptidase family protein
VLAPIERIVTAEASASNAPRPPEITPLDRYALVVNDAEASRRVAAAFREYFSPARVRETEPTSASEDFGSFGAQWEVPSVFWFVGGMVIGESLGLPSAATTLVGAMVCFGLRVGSIYRGWHLPRAIPGPGRGRDTE